MNRKIALPAVAIVAIIALVMAASFMFTAAANAGSERTTAYEGKYYDRTLSTMSGWGSDATAWGKALPMNRGFAPTHWKQSGSGNVTIDAKQAKAVVEAAIPSFKVGTPTSLRTSWVVPIEDAKGVVTSIQVTKVSASTAEQAKSIVQESLNKGWKAGEPKLMGTIYNIPLFDSNNAVIGYVRVDGKSGEIIRQPSTTLTVTSQQAKTIVSDAVKEFKVGEAKDGASVWMVSVKYKDKVVMTVLLGKLNTPTSEGAVKAVQDSLGKGWSAGEPKQLRFIYNVPIIDANGNAIGNIRVDGKTGDITTGFPLLRR